MLKIVLFLCVLQLGAAEGMDPAEAVLGKAAALQKSAQVVGECEGAHTAASRQKFLLGIAEEAYREAVLEQEQIEKQSAPLKQEEQLKKEEQLKAVKLKVVLCEADVQNRKRKYDKPASKKRKSAQKSGNFPGGKNRKAYGC